MPLFPFAPHCANHGRPLSARTLYLSKIACCFACVHFLPLSATDPLCWCGDAAAPYSASKTCAVRHFNAVTAMTNHASALFGRRLRFRMKDSPGVGTGPHCDVLTRSLLEVGPAHGGFLQPVENIKVPARSGGWGPGRGCVKLPSLLSEFTWHVCSAEAGWCLSPQFPRRPDMVPTPLPGFEGHLFPRAMANADARYGTIGKLMWMLVAETVTQETRLASCILRWVCCGVSLHMGRQALH